MPKKNNYINLLLAALLCAVMPVLAQEPEKETTTPVTASPAPFRAPFTEKSGLPAAPSQKLAFFGPLSGENGELGEKLKRGAAAAIKAFNDAHGSDITLLEYDTSPTGVSSGVLLAAAAIDSNVIAGIGPVTADGLTEYISGANTFRLPVISPTVLFQEDIPGNRYFFRNNLAPEDEGRRLAFYAVKKLGKKKLAVIRNDTVFSSRAAAGFTAGALEAGGSVEKEVLTVPGQYDLKEQMLALGGVDPHVVKDLTDTDKLNLDAVAARFVAHVRAFIPAGKGATKVIVLNFTNTGTGGAELREEVDHGAFFAKKLSFGLAKAKDIEMIEMTKVYAFLKAAAGGSAEGKLLAACAELQADFAVTGSVSLLAPGSFKAEVKVINSSGETVSEISFPFLVSVVPQGNRFGIDAFYVSQDTADSDNIVSHLAFFGLKSVYLGIGKWADDKFLAQSASRMEGAAFTTAFFAGSEDPAAVSFASLYRSMYFEEPEELAGFGYEAAGLILSGLEQGVITREGMTNFLVSLNGYSGLNGSITFSGGRFVKSPRILTIRRGTVSESTE